MKYELPDHHGLSDSIIANLVFKEGSGPALSDVQYESLHAGIGRGQSALVVSPTSTGKTRIAVWAIAKSIETGCNAVYLVTLRALAKQKFDDFKSLLLDKYLYGDRSALVIATGDSVENADGDSPAKPLEAPLLVATYEKYLALLSASGIPADMGNTVVVCDEIQLIGDKARGQDVEVLLTLTRNAGWKQFLGLSAVLERKDAQELANWLGVALVVQHAREKHLRYECWKQDGITAVSSERPEIVEENLPRPSAVSLDTLSILISLLDQKPSPVPVIVFCMRKKDTNDLAEALLRNVSKMDSRQLSLAFDGLPETAANTFLAKAMAHRVAVHSADLMDEERQVVERHLLDDKLDVVFATSTLAAGVNFPFGAAIFASCARWDFDKGRNLPIEAAEFHNMAGRVGRMGYDHEQGRVIFCAKNASEVIAARQYLNLGAMPALEPRITPLRFNQLALQLVASGLCRSTNEVEGLVCTTLSALRKQDRNSAAFATWPTQLSKAIEELFDEGLLLKTSTGSLTATPVGKAIAYSGLLPETGAFLLNYATNKIPGLVQCLPTSDNSGDIPKLAFLLFCACFSSPEFRTTNKKPSTRELPYPLKRDYLFDADVYRDDLPEPVWRADPVPINAAKLAMDWIDGAEISALEKSLPELSAGMVRGMFRNLVWALQGFASILAAAADPRNPIECLPKVLRGAEDNIPLMRKLPRFARRLSFRVAEGLPDEVLWMASLNSPGGEYRLSRAEILALRGLGYSTPERVMQSSPEASEARIKAFPKVKPAPQAKANWLRDACRDWKLTQRKRIAEKHLKRANRCPNLKLVEAYYERTSVRRTPRGCEPGLPWPVRPLRRRGRCLRRPGRPRQPVPTQQGDRDEASRMTRRPVGMPCRFPRSETRPAPRASGDYSTRSLSHRSLSRSEGTDFEEVFEEILTALKIRFQKLDDKTKTGAPDYLLLLEESPPLVLELKSREGDKLVDYNKAVEVLSASEIHGHKATFCVTLCHPGVDPSVPNVIAACGRLSVVESTDLGEALLRICEGELTQRQLWQWLSSPGQALVADLPFREYV